MSYIVKEEYKKFIRSLQTRCCEECVRMVQIWSIDEKERRDAEEKADKEWYKQRIRAAQRLAKLYAEMVGKYEKIKTETVETWLNTETKNAPRFIDPLVDKVKKLVDIELEELS